MKRKLTSALLALIVALACISTSACQTSDVKEDEAEDEGDTSEEFAEEVYDEEVPSEVVDDTGVVEEVYNDSGDATSGVQDEQTTEEVVE